MGYVGIMDGMEGIARGSITEERLKDSEAWRLR